MHMNQNRSKNATLNLIIVSVLQICVLIYSLIAKNLFLKEFSLSYWGVYDLFTSFFSSLTVIETGFGAVLLYNLYKPIANDNKDEIIKQLSIFKTIYRVLSIFILVASLIALPFLYDIFNISYEDKVLVYFMYISYIIKILFIYHYTYKSSILSAGQFGYIHNGLLLIIETLSFIFKVVSIKIFHSVYLFTTSLMLIPLIMYIFENKWIDKKYQLGNIDCASFKEIKENGVFEQFKKYTYALIYAFAFNTMDNIIISNMLSTDSVAYTSNYMSIFTAANSVIIAITTSIRGIMADYMHTNKSKEGTKNIFNIVVSLNFLITALFIVGMYCEIDDFIYLWIGDKYLIARNLMLACLIVKLSDCLLEPVIAIFNIEGYIFKEKWPLILSALTNLILTIVFINLYGLIGAYIATILALVIKWLGKFYYILNGIFKDFKSQVIGRYLFNIGLIYLEIILCQKVTNALLPKIDTIYLFLLKTIIISTITFIINIGAILLDRSTRKYISKIMLKGKI